jgi:hypothetical protein
MKRWTLFVALAALAGAIAVSPSHAADKKKDKKAKQFWIHPALESYTIDRIAMMPVVSFDHSLPAETTVEGAAARALKESRFRWLSPSTTRDMLRSFAPNDSVFKSVRDYTVKNIRVDSLAAPGLCSRLRCDALLSVRIDQWEKREIEYDQSGKPSTTVQLHAALVDSTGTLLWTASTSETVEGPYHNANAGVISMSGGDLTQQPQTGQGGAPDYLEVLSPMFKTWSENFPAKPAPAAAPAATPATAPAAADTTNKTGH